MVTVKTPRGSFRPYRSENLCGKRLLVKTVQPNQELQAPRGIAVDEPVLEWAGSQGFDGIAIRRARDGKVLWAPLSRWSSGIPIRRGFGPQRALVWKRLDPLTDQETPTSNGEQTDLFGT